jgi:hypothetical protein
MDDATIVISTGVEQIGCHASPTLGVVGLLPMELDSFVQEPESLKEEIVQELDSLLAAYSQEPGKTPRRRQSAEPRR